jgi:hypothetical protein
MESKRELAKEQLERLGQELQGLYDVLTKDPKKEQRRERAWAMLYGVTSAGFALVARRVLMRVWPILTGEAPPMARLPSGSQASQSAGAGNPELDDERQVVRTDARPETTVDERQPAHEARVEGQAQERG